MLRIKGLRLIVKDFRLRINDLGLRIKNLKLWQNFKKQDKKTKFILIYGAVLIGLILAYITAGLLKPVNRQTDGDSISVGLYFLNIANNTLQREARDIEPLTSNTELIDAVLIELIKGPAGRQTGGFLQRVLPQNVPIIEAANYNRALRLLEIDLAEEYNNLPVKDQLYLRSSVVWTLTEFDFIDDVIFYVSSEQLTNASGQPVGVMNRENLLLNPELSAIRTNTRTITLYFANAGNTALTAEKRTIEVSGAIEYHIVEQLIHGPAKDGLKPTLLPDIKLKDVNTTDGICYVDLGPEFLSKQLTGDEPNVLVIYSIVNSLTELSGIQMVQIIADSTTITEMYGEIDLSMPITRDDGLIE